MTKSLLAFATLVAAAAWPVTASASCFFVYGASNQLVYRSTVTPVDLSKPISEGLRRHFSGGHLVMIPDETGCPDLLVNGESQLFADLGFSNRNGPGSAIGSSPLFRDASQPAGAATRGTAASGETGVSQRRAPRSK
jgi:hypothetical protein